MYKEKAKVIKTKSKCNWYEFGEKFTKIFLKLVKPSSNPKPITFDYY